MKSVLQQVNMARLESGMQWGRRPLYTLVSKFKCFDNVKDHVYLQKDLAQQSDCKQFPELFSRFESWYYCGVLLGNLGTTLRSIIQSYSGYLCFSGGGIM